MNAKVLTLDVETSPNIADVWGLWQQNVSLNQLRESTRMISFAAKWLDKSKVEFYSEFHNGHDAMVAKAHELCDQADVMIHYNGRTFDVPHLNREFIENGFGPPSPFQQIDLLQTVRRRFRFPSNKLDYVSETLGIGNKTHHEGHGLWTKCLAGDEKAWALMRKYNIQDVRLTEQLYLKLQPWLVTTPNIALLGNVEGCPSCGSTERQRRGYAHTAQSTFPQFSCNGCGRWYRDSKSVDRAKSTVVTP
jgi:DNA polymerase III epsilon subunit-like protein